MGALVRTGTHPLGLGPPVVEGSGCGMVSLASRQPPSHGRPGAPGDSREMAGLLHDGTMVWVRLIAPSDRTWFAQWTAQLSPRSRHQRFLHHLSALSSTMLDDLVDNVDGYDHYAVVAFVETSAPCALPGWSEDGFCPVAVGRFIRDDSDPASAEVAYTVGDDWQGRGVGGLLLDCLVTTALAQGILRFTASIWANNHRSLRLLRTSGRVSQGPAEDGVVDVEVVLHLPPALAALDSAAVAPWSTTGSG